MTRPMQSIHNRQTHYLKPTQNAKAMQIPPSSSPALNMSVALAKIPNTLTKPKE
jgi:hypothetical protein